MASGGRFGRTLGAARFIFYKNTWVGKVSRVQNPIELAEALLRIWKRKRYPTMLTFLLWCILFVLCWPLALTALVLYPIIWLVLLPFHIAGIAVHAALALVWAIVMFPARLLGAPFR